MNFSVKDIATATMVLFAVIDIVGCIPYLVDLKSRVGNVNAIKATAVSGLIMIVFLFVGETILDLLGVDVSSFAIAGAFILFFLSLEMILGIHIYKHDTPSAASIVPVAFPWIAGTGTLTTLLSLRAEFRDVENIVAAILVNLVFIFIVLRHFPRLEKLLGPAGLSITRKVFGVILLAIAVKLFRTNFGI